MNQLFVLSLFEEGFGQLIRKIDSIYVSLEDAKKYKEEKEAQEPEYEPCYYEIEAIKINTYPYPYP